MNKINAGKRVRITVEDKVELVDDLGRGFIYLEFAAGGYAYLSTETITSIEEVLDPIKVEDIVSTVEQLDRLPEGSIIRRTTQGTYPWYKDTHGKWITLTAERTAETLVSLGTFVVLAVGHYSK